MSVSLALKFAHRFWDGYEFWLNLQRIHDLDAARASVDASAAERLATAAEGGAAL